MARRVLGVFKIAGDAAYARAVESLLDELIMSACGAALISALRETRRKVRLRPYDGRLGRVNAYFLSQDSGPGGRRSGVYFTSHLYPRAFAPVGSLTGWEYDNLDAVAIRDEPSEDIDAPLLRGEIEMRVRARAMDGACTLFHELVHAYRFAVGADTRAPEDASTVAPQFDNTRELAAILYENCYRAERGLPLRTAHSTSMLDFASQQSASAIWNDPATALRATEALAATEALTRALRAVPLTPHPLQPSGVSPASGLFPGAFETSW